MSEITKTLLNIRSLRAFSRDLTLEQLEEALDKLTIVVEERRESEEKEQAAQAEQEAKLAAIAEQIVAMLCRCQNKHIRTYFKMARAFVV